MMELRVPTHARAAEIRCCDGRLFTGRVFIPISSAHHEGPMRLEEWINDGAPFFAFLPDDAQSAVLLNREQVAVLAFVPAERTPEESEIAGDLPVHRLAVEIADRRLEGEVWVDMPEGQRRVLDYLNRSERFLLIRTPKQWYLVRKSLIVRVIGLQES
jgi:hypothetical protein